MAARVQSADMVLIKQTPLPQAQPTTTAFSTSFALQVMKTQQAMQAQENSKDWGQG